MCFAKRSGNPLENIKKRGFAGRGVGRYRHYTLVPPNCWHAMHSSKKEIRSGATRHVRAEKRESSERKLNKNINYTFVSACLKKVRHLLKTSRNEAENVTKQ